MSESALCGAFVEHARAVGFRVYPETSGWDLLLVSTMQIGAVRVGDQIGVQAKTRANLAVLAQAIRPSGDGSTTHWTAALVEDASPAFFAVATGLGVAVFLGYGGAPQWHATLDGYRIRRHEPMRPCWVPDVELLTPAGVPSPRSITKWKLAALRLCSIAEERGHLTKGDFEDAGVSMSRWVSSRWVIGYRVDKETYHYRITSRAPHKKYPELYAQLRAQSGAA